VISVVKISSELSPIAYQFLQLISTKLIHNAVLIRRVKDATSLPLSQQSGDVGPGTSIGVRAVLWFLLTLFRIRISASISPSVLVLYIAAHQT
jgi:hypothetical protein